MRTIYAHRGNLKGPVPALENNPTYVQLAIDAGFHVEVDVRVIGGGYYLGHDYPAHSVSLKWLESRADRLLLHAKSASTAVSLSGTKFHWFAHSADPYVLTSRGLTWLHDLTVYSHRHGSRVIVPLISKELVDCELFKDSSVCSDYVL